MYSAPLVRAGIPLAARGAGAVCARSIPLAAASIIQRENCRRNCIPVTVYRIESGKESHLEPRIDYQKAFPQEALRGLYQVEHAVGRGGLDEKLLHLIKMRASQINGCAFCLDMHSKDARAAGETEQRLYGLNAWRETPYYTDRERAALEWTEAITLISRDQAPDDLYHRTRLFFDENEMAILTLAAVSINSWNRIAIAFRSVPGSYEPPSLKKAQP
jgi:AhpD family alkylhydroperoxidase